MLHLLATRRVVTCFSQGVNQSAQGTDKVTAIINCHLATGRIGRAGMGPLSLTGQPNAMGGRETGGMATTLAGHMDFDEPARARVALQKIAEDAFEAQVTPGDGTGAWSAYWTVTEHGHSSKVRSGENAGEFLQHDFVVRQYVPAGEYRGPSRLTLRTVVSQAAHPRQVNLVVFEPKTGRPLQALSLGC